MSRPARVVIDRAALRHNYQLLRRLAGAARIMAVVKADAYGHGLLRVAKCLPDADAFAVVCLGEAEQLRAAGVRQAVVLLQGVYCVEDLERAAALGLDLVVHNRTQLDMLAARRPSLGKAAIWLKVDTGMHRLGFSPAELPAALASCKASQPGAAVRLMSHLATAHEPDHAMTRAQLQVFDGLCPDSDLARCIANSAALLTLPAACYQWVRPGLALYGVSPQASREGRDWGLRPVMRLESGLIAVRRLRAGEPVGYGADWRCPEDMPVGILAMGYADGYPRHAGSGAPILVNDRPCALLGRVSMDMLAVDLRACPEARVGDPALLWGRELPVERIARAAGAIPYELLCRVHKRLQFVDA